MKKLFKIIMLSLPFAFLGAFGYSQPLMTKAEGEITDVGETTPIEADCKVVVEKSEHGQISVNRTEGNVGDICVVTAKHDILYKVAEVKVNGNILIEDENISGRFSFPLVYGENKVTAKFVVDQELCGDLSQIVSEAADKDWTNLFSVENVITLVKWVLDGGILIAIIRYYVKDKRLEKKLEDKVQKSINEIVPETTKETVVTTVQDVITPIFNQLLADSADTKRIMSVFAKCMALAQKEGSESEIIDELMNLKIGNQDTLEGLKKYIEDMIEQHEKTYRDTLEAINKIGQTNKEIVEKSEPKELEQKETAPVEKKVDNGTQI